MAKKQTINWKDIAVRSAKTFVQGALAYALYNYASVDELGLQVFVIGAIAAGVSAIWNITIEVKKTK
jgi:hypothetical protein